MYSAATLASIDAPGNIGSVKGRKDHAEQQPGGCDAHSETIRRVPRLCRAAVKHLRPGYSYRSASIGSSLAARCAGHIPAVSPISAENSTAAITMSQATAVSQP